MVKANEEKKWAKHCIYKLPSSVTDLKKSAYKPRTISFGPYHHGDPKLRRMEDHKSRVLVRFLERSGKLKEECISILYGIVDQLMDAYDSLDSKWRNCPERFLEMMLRDGCFMLETMEYRSNPDSKVFRTQYGEKDPIFSHHGIQNMIPYIRRDMIMLENQLPLLLLKKLLSTEDPQQTKEDDYIIKIIVKFCSQAPYSEDFKECEHVLAVYRKLLIKGAKVDADKDLSLWSKLRLWITKKYEQYVWKDRDEMVDVIPDGENIIPSATRLDESGITIQTSKTTSITDINFYGGLMGGVLEIPPIVVDDTTESDFLNLVAFERFHVGAGSDVTSYINFMDDIIDNDKDVKILQNHDIISNAYGSDMAVARLFNTLSKDTTLSPNKKLLRVRKRAKKRCKRDLNKFWGDLIHTYFSNPWSGITLIAAVLVFGLGIVNTVFAILDYYKKD